MLDSPQTPTSDKDSESARLPIRAAALGLLALAAIIALVAVFGSGGDSSSQAPSASESLNPSESVESVPPGSETVAPESSNPSGEAGSTDQTVTPSAPSEAMPPSASQDSVPSGSIVEQDEPQPTGVTVLITSKNWNSQSGVIEVVGSVLGVTTNESTCTAIATQGAHSAAESVSGVFDGQGTSCGLISISMSGMPSGPYEVVIEFVSGQGTTVSDTVTIEVP